MAVTLGRPLARSSRPARNFPSIAVAADGTIGVSYCDFRFKNPNGLPTDRWLVQCYATSTSAATDPACWGNEVRLTDSSFNMEAVVPMLSGDFFLGDYFGLATAGDDFVATFTQPDNQNVTSIFARRVGPSYADDPALNGIGSDPTTNTCRPPGAHCGTSKSCCEGLCIGIGFKGGPGRCN
jgi:hypothetical protein